MSWMQVSDAVLYRCAGINPMDLYAKIKYLLPALGVPVDIHPAFGTSSGVRVCRPPGDQVPMRETLPRMDAV